MKGIIDMISIFRVTCVEAARIIGEVYFNGESLAIVELPANWFMDPKVDDEYEIKREGGKVIITKLPPKPVTAEQLAEIRDSVKHLTF
jgi:hypothetical protein